MSQLALVVKDGNQQPQNIGAQQDASTFTVPESCPAPLNAQGVATPVSPTNPMPVVVVAPAGQAAILKARVNSASGTNATLVKGAAGTWFGALLANTAGSERYLRLFDLNTGPTVGTSVPFLTIPLPPNSTMIPITPPEPIPLANGLSYDITGGNGDTDTTTVSANDVTGLIEYQ